MSNAGKRAHGQIRQSQIITTYGPGAMLDMPEHSVLVSGLDEWMGDKTEIPEPRLVTKLKTLLNARELRLYAPPPHEDDPSAKRTGVPVWKFPQWFITQKVQSSATSTKVRQRMLLPHTDLRGGKYLDDNRKPQPVVPVRFVRACRKGHLGDIQWRDFVHRGKSKCLKQLWLDERGTSADLSEIYVRCECNAERPMSDAAVLQMQSLGTCDGARPWLGIYGTQEPCTEPNRLLIRTASNAYFPQLLSVISLPEQDDDLVKAVDMVWQNFLEYVESLEDLKSERTKKPPVKEALQGFADEKIWAEIQRRKGAAGPPTSVKQVELKTLSASKEEIGEDKHDGDFFARALPKSVWSEPWMSQFERVVLLHRLREVIALAGFTRFESAAPDVDGELEMGVKRAEIARDLKWLPAVENKGEGIFLQVKSALIKAWLERPEVAKREKQLRKAFDGWISEHPGSKRRFPEAAYIMLHSFAHMLITSVSLECGYPSSSIRERIYALPTTGYGILLYTGTSDAEGTLGGLIEVGRQISRHVSVALDSAELCSNDPVCAEHDPSSTHEHRFLHGAACHGCVLISETSCEQHNDFLDRSLVVPTVENIGAEFFKV